PRPAEPTPPEARVPRLHGGVPALPPQLVARSALAAAAVPPPPPSEEPPAPRPQKIMGVPLWPDGPYKWAIVAAVCLASVGTPFLVKLYQNWEGIEQFNEMRNVWLEKPRSSDPKARYLRGKVLPFEMLGDGRGASVDRDLYKGLPDELRPRNPDEVATVAWVEWSTEPITTPRRAWQIYYILGYQYVCKVTLIDRRASKKLGSMTFRGSDPTKGYRDENGYGDRPYSEILAYLRGLPKMLD